MKDLIAIFFPLTLGAVLIAIGMLTGQCETNRGNTCLDACNSGYRDCSGLFKGSAAECADGFARCRSICKETR